MRKNWARNISTALLLYDFPLFSRILKLCYVGVCIVYHSIPIFWETLFVPTTDGVLHKAAPQAHVILFAHVFTHDMKYPDEKFPNLLVESHWLMVPIVDGVRLCVLGIVKKTLPLRCMFGLSFFGHGCGMHHRSESMSWISTQYL